ncbi:MULTISPECIES: type VI secretion system baseplate subunit TssE [Vibrio]|uniref:Type VI secretion system baseplate subunit TssE n=1 Tax=Vibrio mediterranei TaxID=689 RepID=A0A3G4VA44_9VIBR|nr:MULTISPECIES: type VI secretion system baseplate subunit TssE [Vibrio]AYV20021.1 type VI secretion system baseplate subunit TssE [Vibrio mediterranei]MCF4173322.1 type VI secretion system baseplate subunit TssE [Vibrio sp. McD22-P3]MCG9657482.1 type VI secretion system baseplate subunit TssE [Vibrio mediterranei]MCG9661759.1 type VI secretion system baseplate subunit TssE [Vibrio mediterranei]PTC02852.1 type VI secretion system baseplate subunit TssE [Vibrio mediterranei]
MSFYNAFIQSSRQDDEIDDIRYHLTRLLESEAPLIAVENSLSEVRRSSFTFGITDVQLLTANLDQTQLARKIETWLTTYEPRLSDVSVEMLERREGQNCIQFTIVAKHLSQDGEQTLVFDSKIALGDFSAKISEEEYD